MMIKKIGFGLCMLLLASAAATFEMEENYDYQDLGPYRPEIRDDQYQSLLLDRLFNSLQKRDDARLHMRPKFSMIAGYGHKPDSDLMDLKGDVVKKHVLITPKAPKVKTVQPKDDVKKVEKGLLVMICYSYIRLCLSYNENVRAGRSA